jgi:hypothetical protein
MKTIPVFLEEFGGALRLSGSHRRRVLAEAHDHLAEAKEQAIKAGLEPALAEAAAVEAFGEPAYLAARFEADFRTRSLSRVSSAVEAIDCWRADHPVAGATVFIALLTGLVFALWSPLAVFGVVPIWIAYAWLGRQLVSRREPGYRRRLWAWKREHATRFNLVTGAGILIASCWVEATVFFGPTHQVSWVMIAVLSPAYVAALILNYPKRYKPPEATS